jgi:hypothetical protein
VAELGNAGVAHDLEISGASVYRAGVAGTPGQRIDTQLVFLDCAPFGEKDTFRHFGFDRSSAEKQAANDKAGELLKNSPYKDQLGTTQLCLQALHPWR